jgi:hypothetical protein
MTISTGSPRIKGLDRASEQKQEFEAGNREWKRISWSGESKEWGPATVGFAFTEGLEFRVRKTGKRAQG